MLCTLSLYRSVCIQLGGNNDPHLTTSVLRILLYSLCLRDYLIKGINITHLFKNVFWLLGRGQALGYNVNKADKNACPLRTYFHRVSAEPSVTSRTQNK